MRTLAARVSRYVIPALIALTLPMCGDGGDGGEAPDADANDVQPARMLLSFPESIAWVPLLVGREQGYFEDEGISVSTEVTEGASFVIQQIVAGNADYGWAGGESVIIGAVQAPNLRVVACNQEQNIFRIVALDDAGITSLEDLRGRVLGITVAGGGEEPMARGALADAGLADEVEVVPIGEAGPAALKAIQDGRVDAYAAGFADLASLRAQGATFVDITPEEFARTPGDCLVVLEETLADPEKRDILVALGRGWVKAAVFATENPEAALDISCSQVPEECQDMAFATEFMAEALRLSTPLDPTVPIGGLDVEGWRITAQNLVDAGVIESVDVDALIQTLVESEEGEAVAAEIQDFDVEQVRQEATNADTDS